MPEKTATLHFAINDCDGGQMMAVEVDLTPERAEEVYRILGARPCTAEQLAEITATAIRNEKFLLSREG